MSGGDRPRNPFGRGERTIIRPNPGGRLPTSPAVTPPNAPAPPPAAPPPVLPAPSLPPSSYPTPTTPRASPAAPPPGAALARPVAPPPYAAAPSTPAAEDWIQSAPPAPISNTYSESQGPILRVDDLAAPNANPIMRAAGPLLQLLGRLRVALVRASFASLMEQVAEAIKFFERESSKQTLQSIFCVPRQMTSSSISRLKIGMFGRNTAC
jgi:type VI secretion system protein ImpK